MEVEKRDDGSRFKVKPNGRKSRLCKGLDNTCTSEAKKEGLCTGCRTGKRKKDFIDRKENEEFVANGIRYKYIGGQSRKLCIGDDYTCKNLRSHGELCTGHHNGTAQTKNYQYKKGEIFTHNGTRYKFNGKQKVKLCSADDNTCTVTVTRDGLCKKHCPAWRCQFTEFKCDHIGVRNGYCEIHQDNVERSRVKSKGEDLIAKLLQEYDVDFESNKYIKANGKWLSLDFFLPELDAIIEFDGEQHFKAVEYWGGEDGFTYRQANDKRKNEFCEQMCYKLLRVRYDNTDIETTLVEFLEQF